MNLTHERKVGAVVAGALALLVGAVLFIGKVHVGAREYDLTVRWRFVNDLKLDAPVKYAGGPVIGLVRGIAVDADEFVAVRLRVDRRIRIRSDSEFWIFTSGFLGEEYVEVNASPSEN